MSKVIPFERVNLQENSLVVGDCLDWLKKIPSNSVQTCYIDPPFFSGKSYEIIWGNGWETRSFGDRWKGGLKYYAEWMRVRIKEIHRVLRKNGSIFLHCDRHANHYLRMVLDEIFGENNFINEIIWSYQRWTGKTKAFQRTHDNIYYYVKDKNSDYVFNVLYESFSEKSQHKSPRHTTIKNGKLNQVYLEGKRLKAMRNVWEISYLNSQAKERCGYKTQKPIELIKRIIQCSSFPNDIILDCFAGGGSTAVAAIDLGRKFILGDVSPVAIKVTAARLKERKNFTNFRILNTPRTKVEWLNMDGKEFEKKICEFQGWEHSGKDGADGNIDGWANKGQVPVQIKNWTNSVGEKPIKEFVGTLLGLKKKRGFFVAWKYTTRVYDFLIDIEKDHGVKIELKTVEEILEGIIISSDEKMKIEEYYKNKKCIISEDAA